MPPMALKAAPKLDQSASSGSRPIASPSAPPTREPVAEEEKRAEPVAADVSSTTRIKLEPEELDVKPILNTNASSSDSSTSLPRPPDGYATWRDLYVRENLSEIAQAQARIHGPDPRTARRPHYASYGRVRIPTSSCGKCAHHGWPCLWIDPPVRPEHRSPVKVQKCILCQEHGIPCQESFGAEPYKHTNAIAAYHNAAIQLGERPGLWMGPGVEDLDILPPQWK
ncbi:hypothetical protein MKEN_01001900 [Mycena kentingensis (nom. inval.)]|nr:hypothetical protein MKEN_01001900 [Mycena kentingensis (nom. inval.)]